MPVTAVSLGQSRTSWQKIEKWTNQKSEQEEEQRTVEENIVNIFDIPSEKKCEVTVAGLIFDVGQVITKGEKGSKYKMLEIGLCNEKGHAISMVIFNELIDLFNKAIDDDLLRSL